MLIDCDCCVMKGTETCDDCVVTVMLSEGPVEIDTAEAEALSALADAGLVPRLRLVPGEDPPPPGETRFRETG
jgi:hypothetical protein